MVAIRPGQGGSGRVLILYSARVDFSCRQEQTQMDELVMEEELARKAFRNSHG